MEYVVSLVTKTRPNSYQDENDMIQYIEWGAGPRASQFMLLAAKCHAAINGKYSPDIEDVKAQIRAALAIGKITQEQAYEKLAWLEANEHSSWKDVVADSR